MKYLFAVLVLLGVLSCVNGNKVKNDAAQQSAQTFIMPEIPAIYQDPEARGAYLAEHYWDNYDFGDSVLLFNEEVTETALANYIALLWTAPQDVLRRSASRTMDRASEDSLGMAHFSDLLEKYLDDPNSPMKNEELYIPFLEYILASPKVDELMKLRPQARYNMLLRNRVGHKGADFNFRLASGKRMKLSDVKTDFKLLYINNPDCAMCRDVTGAIKESPVLQYLISEGVLQVVAIYPDEDLDAWRRHQWEVPSEWVNGYNEDLKLRNEDLYDLRAIPTLYLLDRNMTVIVKDASTPAPIEAFFTR